jgi:hypothetical protein
MNNRDVSRGKFVINAVSIKTPLALSSICLLVMIQTAMAQSAEPKTIRDYFLTVPEECIGFSKEEREVLLKGPGIILDIKNGYLSYNASDNPEEFELALFKQTDGAYIVAISIDANPDFESKSALHLLKYDKGRWNDVTKAILAVSFNDQYIYTLPRIGTTIQVTTIKGKKLYDLIGSTINSRSGSRE